LEAEMTDHLNYEKNGNRKTGETDTAPKSKKFSYKSL